MSGASVGEFNDLVEATGPVYVTGPESLVNDAVKNTYYFGRLLRGDVNQLKKLRGGSDIRDNIVFRDNGTGEFYQPGASHDWQNPQRLERVQLFWRFLMVHMSWTEQEILLNQGIALGTDDARFQQYVDILMEKETIMWTAKWNFMENALWATPDVNTMEGEGAAFKDPYSIPAFINEEANGLFGTDDSFANPWTTVEGLDPTSADVNGKWEPQTSGYLETEFDTPVVTPSGLINSFDSMWQDVYFEQPYTQKQYFEDERLNKQMICTSKAGRSFYQQELRRGQDHFIAGPQDPAYPDPMFHGIPVVRVSTLDDAPLYADASDGRVDEITAVKSGPRYYWVNGNYLFPTFHSDRYFYKHEVTKHFNVPDTWVCPVATWYNVMCTSRQRQGIVSPINVP